MYKYKMVIMCCMKKIAPIIFSLFVINICTAQNNISKVWVADNGDGTYKNPVLHADYSDPDAIRVGGDYYMTASSFEYAPGLPILHSKDLVNWKIISYALPQQPPVEHFSKVRGGEGVWAPSIRYHKGEFYIYYPDPDFGIYLIKTKDIKGAWSKPVLVEAGKGLIDPCPLWDDDGKVYLVHGFAGSRAGIKSVIAVKEMNSAGDSVINAGNIVFDGHENDPTLEGPKFYKRNGYYYIFAPAGGVSTGWQLALRSKNVYGPYERKVVMAQGKSSVNGPHQGAWVDTETGEDWFLHFQEKDAYGRIVHLQPMTWKNDWPVIGEDKDGDGCGDPVLQYKKPNIKNKYAIETPVESDEFNGINLGFQWQWHANPKAFWYFNYVANGVLRLYSQDTNDKNLWFQPNVLSQKFPAEQFTATTKFTFTPYKKLTEEKAGLTILGLSYASIYLESDKDGKLNLYYAECKQAEKKGSETITLLASNVSNTIYLKTQIAKGAQCTFSYSTDGKSFTQVNKTFTAQPGRWTGAKVGIFCTRNSQTNDSGYADFDWFRVDK